VLTHVATGHAQPPVQSLWLHNTLHHKFAQCCPMLSAGPASRLTPATALQPYSLHPPPTTTTITPHDQAYASPQQALDEVSQRLNSMGATRDSLVRTQRQQAAQVRQTPA